MEDAGGVEGEVRIKGKREEFEVRRIRSVLFVVEVPGEIVRGVTES